MKTDKLKSSDILLAMQGIVKDFGGTRALDQVDFDVRGGEVHALIGENGAGKSTLVNVLAGHFSDYKGLITFAGQDVRITNPRQGRQIGIAVIFQELSVLPNFTVAENIMLGEETGARWSRKMDRSSLNAQARQTIDLLRFDLDPDEPVGRLSRARQCMVEIAGAVRRNVKLLVFDEPTACLGSEDVEKLFSVIRELKSRGLGIVYISHRITELPRIADRVTVLRDAKVVGTRNIAGCRLSDLTRMMLGHDLTEFFPEKTNRPGKTILKVHGLSRPGVFEDISFELREGEILGIAGLVGSGRTEIARAVFGVDKASGTLEFQGATVPARSPSLCRRLGIGMVPENRKREGNITGRPISENLNISILDRLAGTLGFQSPRRLALQAGRMVERMRIEPPIPKTNIQNLSGGNQQKVIVGRWLAAESKVVIFDEPTQGIDVGTKSQIYRLIMDMACKGRAIILICSELLEITKLADRILVIRAGRLVREMPGPETDEDTLLALCMGKGKSE
ncbi:MAG TPA: sugar ABC transporter ATP-binding protein [Sedimentisphaerales bacterium]|nr:sugar ABC transporter ATP-binding protein [Sedimentisphaerales bacterium]